MYTYSGCMILYIPNAIPFFPHPHKHFSLLFLSLIIAILVGIKCGVSLGLLCISQLINDVEYFSRAFWPFVTLFGEILTSCPLLNSFLIVLVMLSCRSHILLDTIPISHT